MGPCETASLWAVVWVIGGLDVFIISAAAVFCATVEIYDWLWQRAHGVNVT